jgi:hypothetical protein
MDTCRGQDLDDDPARYVYLGAANQTILDVVFSWKRAELPWADRWDVYVLGSPVHLRDTVNSLCFVLLCARKGLAKKSNGRFRTRHTENSLEIYGRRCVSPAVDNSHVIIRLGGNGHLIGAALGCSMLSVVNGLFHLVERGQTLKLIKPAVYRLGGGRFSVDIEMYGRKATRVEYGPHCDSITRLLFQHMRCSKRGFGIFGSKHSRCIHSGLWIVSHDWLDGANICRCFGWLDELETPAAITPIAREVPPKPWYAQSHFSLLVASLLVLLFRRVINDGPTLQASLRERYLELLHAKQNLHTNAAAAMPTHCAMSTTH